MDRGTVPVTGTSIVIVVWPKQTVLNKDAASKRRIPPENSVILRQLSNQIVVYPVRQSKRRNGAEFGIEVLQLNTACFWRDDSRMASAPSHTAMERLQVH
jgi:hypothetical protein